MCHVGSTRRFGKLPLTYLRFLPVPCPAFLVKCQAPHQEHTYGRKSGGACPFVISCEAVASASPSVAYLRFPVTGHFESSCMADDSNTALPRNNPLFLTLDRDHSG